LAARSLDMPLSLRASYCLGFFTFADFDGTDVLPSPGSLVACLPWRRVA
jgi:hypothetical protein